MSKVLVIYQSFGGSTKSLAEAAAVGVSQSGAEADIKDVTKVTADDLSDVDGIILATTQPFQSMAGDTKKLFEQLWLGRDKIKKGTHFATIICYKTDPQATQESLKMFADYLELKPTDDWLTVSADDIEAGKEQARQLGIAIVQGD
jgi:NAD(P)H dehydrogenase (quinone)